VKTQEVISPQADPGQSAPYSGVKQWDYPGTLLAAFPKNTQSTIANIFCNAVRDAAQTVASVIEAVEWNLIERQEWGISEHHCLAPIIKDLHDAVISPTSDAPNFAAFILWRESLTLAEKDRLKTAKGKEFVTARMASEPATEPQKKYLRSLSCTEEPESKLHASQLIEKYKK